MAWGSVRPAARLAARLRRDALARPDEREEEHERARLDDPRSDALGRSVPAAHGASSTVSSGSGVASSGGGGTISGNGVGVGIDSSGNGGALRSVGGLISADPLSRRQETPSNVVVLFTRVTPDVDPFAPDGVNVHTQGTGRALYFRDGHLVIGSWLKRAIAAPLELLDPRGKPQLFNPGQTWIEAVPQGNPVTWSPWSGR